MSKYKFPIIFFKKYLGVQLDQNLKYQKELKSVLWKKACGIKNIYCVRAFYQQKPEYCY